MIRGWWSGGGSILLKRANRKPNDDNENAAFDIKSSLPKKNGLVTQHLTVMNFYCLIIISKIFNNIVLHLISSPTFFLLLFFYFLFQGIFAMRVRSFVSAVKKYIFHVSVHAGAQNTYSLCSTLCRMLNVYCFLFLDIWSSI